MIAALIAMNDVCPKNIIQMTGRAGANKTY